MRALASSSSQQARLSCTATRGRSARVVCCGASTRRILLAATGSIAFLAVEACQQPTAARAETVEQILGGADLSDLAPQLVYIPPPRLLYYVRPLDDPEGPAPTTSAFTSIRSALAAAGPTAPVTIRLAPGQYRERIVLIRPDVTIEPESPGARCEVVWETAQPYQHVIDAGGGARNCSISGLTLRHASKSVADNHAVYIHDGSDLRLADCDITSSTGNGVAIEEGATPTLSKCRVHDCVGNGIAVFSPLDPDATPPTGGSIEGCVVERNKLDGLLVRGPAEPRLEGSVFRGNRGGEGVVYV